MNGQSKMTKSHTVGGVTVTLDDEGNVTATGSTFKHRDALHKAGMEYSRKTKTWIGATASAAILEIDGVRFGDLFGIKLMQDGSSIKATPVKPSEKRRGKEKV